MKHMKTFEAFIDKKGHLQAFSKSISINGDIFEFDFSDIEEKSDISYIEGKIYFKPLIKEYTGSIIYDSNLGKFFSEFPEEFYDDIEDYQKEFDDFCMKVKKELIR